MRKNEELKVVFSGGGTGGHYYPALSVIKYLDRCYNKLDVIYFTTKGRIEEKKLPTDFPKAKLIPLNTKGLERPLYNVKNINRAFEVLRNKRKVEKIIKEFKPVFGFLTGGYVTVPVGLALKKQNIPFYLHEQNSILGISNKVLSRWAKKVFVSYEETKLNDKFILTGNPVRTPENEIPRTYLRSFGIKDLNKRCILVFGGSLGSNEIDELMYRVYNKEKINNYIHITKNQEKFKQFPNVFTFEYIENLYELMAVSDEVISRAGATTLAEIQFYDLSAILIPWKGAAENHQLKNALSLQKKGKVVVFDEENVEIDELINFLNQIQPKNEKFIYTPKINKATESIVNNIDEIL
ncbi:MAG: UDP-N-acetylglucosamine--N-acetylmuramyl-(pentapeptide) pyrophosphoryl-undecaprenol N-acetylglucosamine transferase [Petrotoga mobilis]|nr:MAG: UDP-N-acetylglucosamine--N-acetylmuramyl-(pentapeptide) pyrophosphoryl-undecaprenol N-acetylglucosamine transferase [Petrotoga mobilis]